MLRTLMMLMSRCLCKVPTTHTHWIEAHPRLQPLEEKWMQVRLIMMANALLKNIYIMKLS